MDARLGSELERPTEGPSSVPALLAVLAPLSVVVALETTGNVLVAFAAYHLAFCLIVPLTVLGFRHRAWAPVAERLALQAPSREGWLAGAAMGVGTAGAILGGFALAGDGLLGPVPLIERLIPWGIQPGLEVPLFVYMLVFNSGAEELFWRGYLHTEAAARLGPTVAIPLVAVAFASYHVYTLAALLPDPGLVAFAAAGILVGALLWAGLRQRYRSVWPPVLAHVGATAGYMTVFAWLV